jgi:hypothetical protein
MGRTSFEVRRDYGSWEAAASIRITERSGDLVSGWLTEGGQTVRFTSARVYRVGEHEAVSSDYTGALRVQILSSMLW